MLQKQTVEPNTLSILEEIMEIEALSSYNLVGGTALSLLLGHRKSIDLDLFSNENKDNEEILIALNTYFGKRIGINTNNKVGIFCFVDGVKIDIIHYPFDNIYPIETIDKIRMLNIRDISAMKTQAILGIGVKKDFFDLHEILKKYTLSEVISFYELKYPSQYLMISIPQAIIYFDDANDSQDPVSLNNTTWEQVKANLRSIVNEYLK